MNEKLRKEIATALPSIGKEDVERIAEKCECSIDTVYRMWRKIRGLEKGRLLSTNKVVLELAELAIERKKDNKVSENRLGKIMKQLSAA